MAGLKGLHAWMKYTDKVTRTNRKEIEKLVAKVGDDIVRDAKSVVPVKTGTLKKSIRSKVGSDRLSVSVGSDVYYATYVEFGTYMMPARPYLTPAIATYPNKLAEGMLKSVKLAIGSEGK